MKCADVSESLFLYSEGAMGTWEAVKTRLHIAGCERCRERLSALSDSRLQLTEALRDPLDSPDVSSGVMSQLVPAHRPVSTRGRRWVRAVAPTVLAGVAAVLLTVCRQPNPVKPTVQPGIAVVRTPAPPNRELRRPEWPQPREREKVVVFRRRHIAPRRTPHNAPEIIVRDDPKTVQEESRASIVVVATPPPQPEASSIEIEATNSETGDVVIYGESRDERGNRQSYSIAFSQNDLDKEDTVL